MFLRTWIIALSACLAVLFPLILNGQEVQGDSLQSDTATIPVVSGQGKGVGADTLQPFIKDDSIQPLIETGISSQADQGIYISGNIKPADTIHLKRHNPKTAAWMSAAVPGLGQIYNRKYWKLPIIYVGLGVCGYFAWTNTVKFRKYKETYRFRVGVDSLATDYFPNETDATVLDMKEYHHKNIEISYIAAGLIYLLNIVDATVDAHLFDFDITDELSMRIEPSLNNYYSGISGNTGTGMRITLKF